MDPSAPAGPSRAASLDELAASTERLIATAHRLDAGSLHAPSALPGWTRGHVIAHLARNADGLSNLVTWADTGVETAMYASREARDAAIEADAYRSGGEQLTDLIGSAAHLTEQLTRMAPAADHRVLRMVTGAEVEGWEIVLLRIREVEIHHVDLAAGYTVKNWTEGFGRRTLDQVAPGFAARAEMPFGRLVNRDGCEWRVGDGSATLTGSTGALLGWLVGRADRSAVTPTGREDVPPAPRWA